MTALPDALSRLSKLTEYAPRCTAVHSAATLTQPPTLARLTCYENRITALPAGISALGALTV